MFASPNGNREFRAFCWDDEDDDVVGPLFAVEVDVFDEDEEFVAEETAAIESKNIFMLTLFWKLDSRLGLKPAARLEVRDEDGNPKFAPDVGVELKWLPCACAFARSDAAVVRRELLPPEVLLELVPCESLDCEERALPRSLVRVLIPEVELCCGVETCNRDHSQTTRTQSFVSLLTGILKLENFSPVIGMHFVSISYPGFFSSHSVRLRSSGAL